MSRIQFRNHSPYNEAGKAQLLSLSQQMPKSGWHRCSDYDKTKVALIKMPQQAINNLLKQMAKWKFSAKKKTELKNTVTEIKSFNGRAQQQMETTEEKEIWG